MDNLLTCKKCKVSKDENSFHRCKNSSTGRKSWCKDCRNQANRESAARNPDTRRKYRENNKETMKEYQSSYYIENKESIIAKNKKWKEDNPEYMPKYSKQYRQKNLESLRGYSAQWYLDNIEDRREYNREYAKNNSRQAVERSRKWQRENPERYRQIKRITHHRRRARENAVLNIEYTSEQLYQRILFYGNKCWICGNDWTEIDHVKPIAKGGANCLSNLRPSCRLCNAKKSAKWYGPRWVQNLKNNVFLARDQE